MKVEVAWDKLVLAHSVTQATTFAKRMRGLLGRPPLRPGEALLIEPAAQVHTFGMRYPIDVVFCDSDQTVLHIVRSMRPQRLTKWVRGARVAIELTAGAVPTELRAGAVLDFSYERPHGE